MIQCPSCASFNDPAATFCNQCGRPLSKGKVRLNPLSRLRLAGFLLALAVSIALLVAYSLRKDQGGAVVVPEEPQAVVEDAAPQDENALHRAELEEPNPLALDEIRRRLDPAIILVELFDSRGETLREIRGILLEPVGSVLCRFRPLLGSHTAVCKAGRGSDPNVSVGGIIAYDAFWNLALLELRLDGASPKASPLAVTGSTALQAGMDLVAASIGLAVATQVSEYPYFTPDGISHGRLAEDPPLPQAALVAVDSYGAVVGLCQSEPMPAVAEGDGAAQDAVPPPRPRVLVDPLFNLVDFLGKPASQSLAEVTRTLYEGTFGDLMEKALRAAEAQDLPAAVDLLCRAIDRAGADGVVDEELQAAVNLLHRAIDGELDRRRSQKDAQGAEGILAVAVKRFPQERKFWLELGAVRSDLEEHREAIEALLEAQRIEQGSEVDAALQGSYLAGAAREASLGRSQEAAAWLEKGVEILPNSARLRLELAKLYRRWGFLDDAARVFQTARSLDPALASEIDAALEEIDRAIRRQETLVLKIPEGAKSLQAEATVNGRANYRFIIDTGATYTSIPQVMAEELGYRLGPGLEQILIGTANGVINAYVIVLDSVNLQGYAVRNLKAVVLPQKTQVQVGLLGLNFLNNFRFTLDPGRGEFRLERR